jgi:signal transduction histidine kinase/ActR/RegA family two-component response regulator
MKDATDIRSFPGRLKRSLALFTQYFSNHQTNFILYTLLVLIFTSALFAILSRMIMAKNLAQKEFARHVLFEIDYAHSFIVRDVDVSLRGFALIPDDRYLYRSNAYLKIDLENNFQRLDSLLALQGYNDAQGLEAINAYKTAMRNFVDYHGEMIDLIRAGRMDEFHAAFTKDIGANFWPIYTQAYEAIARFEDRLTQQAMSQYRFLSISTLYIQFFLLLIGVPSILFIVKRLKEEKKTMKLLEERKLADERSRVKENMLSVMSHEIRTPLNSLVGLTNLLINRDPRPDQLEVVKTLKDSGDHLLHIVNDILDYNKIQAKRLELEMTDFDLNEILHQIHSMYYRMAAEKALSFMIHRDSSIPVKLVGDSTRLIQILSNLVSNAIKFTSTGTVGLHVNLRKQDGDEIFTEFVVKDSGIGIAEESMSFVFQPFAQLEKHITRKFGGTGLGLLIVKSLTELMNGEVLIESKEGQGTSFTVLLPFKVQTPGTTGQSSKPASVGLEFKGMEVLYVEDVASNRFLVKHLLSDHSIVCSLASNGLDAISVCKTRKFDIILLDIQMPDIDGYSVAHQVRTAGESMNQTTPIIMFSAYTDVSAEMMSQYAIDDSISKPFKPEELFAKFRKALLKQGAGNFIHSRNPTP